jgi:hypothetical protein
MILFNSINSTLTYLSACYQGTFATIEVGPNKKLYIIHKDLLAFYSDYFRAAFNGSFKEATQSKISLHDESEDVFDIVNQFVYSRVIADGKGEKLSWDILIRVWVFGDKHMIPSLQNAVMDVLVKKNKADHFLPTNKISNIWENTLYSSPLRNFILDRAVYKLDVPNIRRYEDRWTQEALWDLVEAFANKEVTKKNKLPARAKCYYHIHKEGEEC